MLSVPDPGLRDCSQAYERCCYDLKCLYRHVFRKFPRDLEALRASRTPFGLLRNFLLKQLVSNYYIVGKKLILIKVYLLGLLPLH